MYWIIFALLEPFFHGFANVIDNHFTNNLFKKTTTLVFFASFTNILFLPIIFLLDFPSFITPSQIPFFIILGLTGIGYLYPYYKALQNDDTSIVVSLFSLGKIFVPLLAFLLVGEILAISQYIGFFVVILIALFWGKDLGTDITSHHIFGIFFSRSYFSFIPGIRNILKYLLITALCLLNKTWNFSLK